MKPHPRAMHVLASVTRGRGSTLNIKAYCQACGELMEWVCHAGPPMAAWRVEQFVNLHLHGTGRPVRIPMPR